MASTTTCLPCAAAKATWAELPTSGASAAGLAVVGGIAAGVPWPVLLLVAFLMARREDSRA